MEELIRDLLGDNFHAQERRAYIYHQASDLYTKFPFQAHLYGLPVPIVKDCLVGLTKAVESQAAGDFSPNNYEEWMRGFFGEGIAEHLMIPYAKEDLDRRALDHGFQLDRSSGTYTGRRQDHPGRSHRRGGAGRRHRPLLVHQKGWNRAASHWLWASE